VRTILLGGLIAVLAACSSAESPAAWAANHETTGPTRYPLAVDPAAVGNHAGQAKSGGGYFYDEVLEYRVWMRPARGAESVARPADQ